jgi:hypothetical protein
VLDSGIAAVLVTLRNAVGNFVDMRAWHPLATRHECRAVAKQLVHVFKVKTFRLRLETPEENSVEEVTDHEDEVEFLADLSVCSQELRDCASTHPADRCDRDWGHLADHRVESERGHCSRIAVPKSSAGMAQLNGPLVMKKTTPSVSDSA